MSVAHQPRPLRFDRRLPTLQGSVGKRPTPPPVLGGDAVASLCRLCGLHAHHLRPPPRPVACRRGPALKGCSALHESRPARNPACAPMLWRWCSITTAATWTDGVSRGDLPEEPCPRCGMRISFCCLRRSAQPIRKARLCSRPISTAAVEGGANAAREATQERSRGIRVTAQAT